MSLKLQAADGTALVFRTLVLEDGQFPYCTIQADANPIGLYNDILEYDLQSHLQPRDTVCEVGTGVGFLPVLLSRWFPSVTYFGCEPSLVNYLATLGTCLANGIRPEVDFLGVGAKDATGLFRTHPSGIGGTSQGVALPEHILFENRIVPFSTFLRGRRFDVLVLDCEGAEYEVANDLPPCRLIVAECHPHLEHLANGVTCEQLATTLKRRADLVMVKDALTGQIIYQ